MDTKSSRLYISHVFIKTTFIVTGTPTVYTNGVVLF